MSSGLDLAKYLPISQKTSLTFLSNGFSAPHVLRPEFFDMQRQASQTPANALEKRENNTQYHMIHCK